MRAKLGAWVGITISAVLFLASAVGAVIIWESGMYDYASAEICRETLYEKAANQYAMRALESMNFGEDADFDNTYFRYGIVKSENIDDFDLKDKGVYVKSNFTEKIDTEALYKINYEIGENTDFSYSGTLLGGVSKGEFSYTSNEIIYRPVYNIDDGIFYYDTSGGLYPVRGVELSCPGVGDRDTQRYQFVYDFGKKMYRYAGLIEQTTTEAEAEAEAVELTVEAGDVAEYEQWIVDTEALDDVLRAEYMTFDRLAEAGWPQEEWGDVLLDGKSYQCNGSDIWWVDNETYPDDNITEETYYWVDENGFLQVYHSEAPTETYWVVVQMPKEVPLGWSKDLFVQANTLATVGYGLRYGIYVLLFASLAVSIILFVFLLNAAGHRRNTEEIVTTWIDCMPFDVYLGFACLTEYALFFFMIQFSYYAMEPPAVILFVAALVAAGWVLLLSFITLAVRIKRGKWWKNTVIWWVIHGIWHIVWTILSNVGLLWKIMLAIGALSLVEFWVVSWDGIGRITIFWFLEKIILVPLLLLAVVQMQKLKSGAERMTEGDLEHRIDTEKMFWEFRWHGENLNNISIGMSRVVDERMKSERFKTELITNVSHDIKTPLTSIINYVDLLEKEDLKNEKAAEYLEVLERQSARLKKLIEDLMEASKASTGNLAVHLEQLEAGVSLVQIVGEFEEKLQANELKLLIDKPEEPVYILADSRHFWRVADNLMNNICKYAQPGTRVYVNLEKKESGAVLTFRNTSRYPLNISSEELMERFVRGDSSRNTEGSGLGLSIARSLMDLMGGTFALYVDGDLFKVTLGFPLSKAMAEDASQTN